MLIFQIIGIFKFFEVIMKYVLLSILNIDGEQPQKQLVQVLGVLEIS
jgi:hypothetical protein